MARQRWARKNDMPEANAADSKAAKSPLPGSHAFAVLACFLGWTLDAFDFFVVVFIIDLLATRFHVSKTDIIWTLTATLAMRPVGAFLFGLLADRYGRRLVLISNVLFFTIVEALCGFASTFAVFIVLRSLYGIGMGGEWGVGASLAMEAAPRRRRGILSGVLQSGYPIGYMLAAVAARFILPALGWRWMFWAGAIVAAAVLFLLVRIPESRAWVEHREASAAAILRTVGRHWRLFVYLAAMMTLMMFLSHGTQDLYPDFLKSAHGFAPRTVSDLAILYNIGAVVGSILFGRLSERFGRRRSMIAAMMLSLAVIPLWAFGGSIASLATGAFLMQVGVQGAWGVIPAHLNELSPDAARSLVPGLAYQLGILFAAPTNSIEYALRDHVGYQWAMAGFELAVIVLGAIIIGLGRENRGKDFHAPRAT